jgi:hypothetical protein
MAASARMSTNWAVRMSLVAVAFSAFAAWCLFDATVGYPRFNQRAAEHNRLLAAGQIEQWPALAAQKGWPATFRKDDQLPGGAIGAKTRWDIGTQYVMMGACIIVLVGILIRLARASRRTMGADESGFHTVEGRVVPYADISAIDLRRWQRKSIARVHFRLQGRERTTDIDDWIYQGGEAILAELQRRTGLGLPPPTQPDTPAGETHGQPDDHGSA